MRHKFAYLWEPLGIIISLIKRAIFPVVIIPASPTDAFSRSSTKVRNLREKITPRRVSRANIKFRPQTYDASVALSRTPERAVRLGSLSNAAGAHCTFHVGLRPSAMQPQQSRASS